MYSINFYILMLEFIFQNFRLKIDLGMGMKKLIIIVAVLTSIFVGSLVWDVYEMLDDACSKLKVVDQSLVINAVISLIFLVMFFYFGYKLIWGKINKFEMLRRKTSESSKLHEPLASMVTKDLEGGNPDFYADSKGVIVFL